MIIDNKRAEIQQEAILAWKNNNCKGLILLPTGTGKTFTFLRACIDFPVTSTILFLAETTQRELDLREDIIKYSKINKKILKYNIIFACYQSAHKWENLKFNFVCADEIHEGATPVYSRFFFNNTYEALMCLTATLPKDKLYEENSLEYSKLELLYKIAPIVYQRKLDTSVKEGTNAQLNIFIINHELDSSNKNLLTGSKEKQFYSTEKAIYDYWNLQFENSKASYNEILIRNTAGKRAKVLYNLPSKITSINKLLKEIKGKTIIFGESLDFLLQITKNTVSSRNKTDINNKIREQFDNNEIDLIAAQKLLTQGANLSNLDNIILSSYNSTTLPIVQKLGRVRLNGDRIGNVFIFVTKNSQEEKWFSKAFEDITAYNFIKCENIEECIKTYLNYNNI